MENIYAAKKGQYQFTTAFDLYIGEKRSGKDLSMVHDVFELVQLFPKITIYSNFWLNPKYFKNVIYIDSKMFESMYLKKTEFFNSIFLISELHIFFDSRKFTSRSNLLFSYFVGQLGKRKNALKGNTHFYEMIDKRLRDYTERKIFCYKGLIDKNNLWSQLNDYNSELSDQQNEKLFIKRLPIIRKLFGINFFEIPENENFVYAKKMFDKYNRDEIIFKNQ